ncbi:hypothetical protein A3J98_01740 [candidate division WS6 bacterium RIFOXYC1_FULL_33_10]|uniref:Uncharacterized protein n=1 Tax=candidate division WS6 bacterium RIFOXYC1_FULL_33_10 TaxID=1802606 RepID=A0A1F4UGK5_9BACT|nr:MAG: hypothetical protein A3J98_01740 [candidate division WS6 bacterium RIFOXYC1_FULL_33_10]
MINKKICLFILILLLLSVLLCIYLTSGSCVVPKDDDIDKDSNTTQTYMENNFRLESKYISNNNWEYTVTGDLPNPCYKATVDTTVAESYPEQVTVTVTTTAPSGDEMCAQVIQEFSYEGTFSASDKAVIDFEVK